MLNLDNYYFVHQKGKNKKGGGICIYIHKQLEFKLRNDFDIFKIEIEACSVEIINSKSRNFIVTGVYSPPKGDIKVFKSYSQDFLKKKSTSKTVFMVGDFRIHSLDYDNNRLVKHFLNISYAESNQSNENNSNCN